MTMDERVHPENPHADDTESARSSRFTNDDSESLRSSSASGMESCLLKKPRAAAAPPGSSYVIQIPKDQIYRLPPPENAHLFHTYTRRATHGGSRSSSRRRRSCLLWASGLLALLLLALAAAAAVLYFVSRPKLPTYSVDSIRIRGFGANLTGPVLSPRFDLAIRADNRRNGKIGIDYRGGGTAGVAYSNAAVAAGAWPAFRQGSGNVTVVGVALRGSGIRLSGESLAALRGQQARRRVPLEVDAEVPVGVRLGPIASWTFRVKVRCDVVVDKLGPDAKVVSRSCKANAAW